MAWCDDGTDHPKMAHVHFAKTAPGGFLFLFFYYLLDCAASFHIVMMEMHLHKVLMRFEGRGGVSLIKTFMSCVF